MSQQPSEVPLQNTASVWHHARILSHTTDLSVTMLDTSSPSNPRGDAHTAVAIEPFSITNFIKCGLNTFDNSLLQPAFQAARSASKILSFICKLTAWAPSLLGHETTKTFPTWEGYGF